MPRFLLQLPRRLFLVVMLLGSVLITISSLSYFDFAARPFFMIEKMPLRFEALWLASLRIHVATALVTFPLCLVLMTRWIQRRPTLHRWLGRSTGYAVLALLVPSGVVLAFDAKGGALSSLGFLLTGAIVAAAMVLGIGAARRRDFVAHRRAMNHVVAQMSVAVTSRAMILGLDRLGFEPGLAYVVSLWVPVLFSAFVAELVSGSVSLKRIGNEISPFAFLARVRPPVRSVPRAGR
ncbi:MAG: DUF2306 domain-containing protein [Myxococcota bacterium]|nr:DUF2306 domain-containing protein [Myxococcota bacterium]